MMKDDVISITKGIAIILMVIGHSGCPKVLDDFIYMFHMPLFFIVSGMYFKDSYLTNRSSRLLFLSKRIKGLYKPYVLNGMLFLFLHNIFFNLNIYNSKYGYNGDVSHLYDTKDYLIGFVNVITMRKTEQLLGGYWFLEYLFKGWVLFFALRHFLSSFYIFVICLIGGTFIYKFKDTLPIMDLDFLICAIAFISLGHFLRDAICKCRLFKMKWIYILITLLIVFWGSLNFPSAIGRVYWLLFVPFVFCALSGTIMVYLTSTVIFENFSSNCFSKFLKYSGDNSLTILTWHFLSFKVVTLAIIIYYNLSIDNLAHFPRIMYFSQMGWWIIYSVVGVLLPLTIHKIVRNIKG